MRLAIIVLVLALAAVSCGGKAAAESDASTTPDAGVDALDLHCHIPGRDCVHPGRDYCTFWLAADASPPPADSGEPDLSAWCQSHPDSCDGACLQGPESTLCNGQPPAQTAYNPYYGDTYAVCLTH